MMAGCSGASGAPVWATANVTVMGVRGQWGRRGCQPAGCQRGPAARAVRHHRCKSRAGYSGEVVCSWRAWGGDGGDHG